MNDPQGSGRRRGGSGGSAQTNPSPSSAGTVKEEGGEKGQVGLGLGMGSGPYGRGVYEDVTVSINGKRGREVESVDVDADADVREEGEGEGLSKERPAVKRIKVGGASGMTSQVEVLSGGVH